MNRYIPMYRPAGFESLPTGLKWDYVEAPRASFLSHITRNRPDLPLSTHPYGIIETTRPLTAKEIETFELQIAD